MKINVPRPAHAGVTHEGGRAAPNFKPIDELRRTVLACLLWEDNFYESGEAVADRIKRLVPNCTFGEVQALAIEAREQMKLRHVPLLLIRELARLPLKALDFHQTITRCIQRVDEITELLALVALDAPEGDRKALRRIPNQIKKGIANAFLKFDEYQFAKYDRDGAVKLRDALFLCHPNPSKHELFNEKSALFKAIADGTLKTPDTWEVALSGGADKKATFERLLQENRLGYLALLRNLRNMKQAGVDVQLVAKALIDGAQKSKALPFRFIAAAKACPEWEPIIDAPMLMAMAGMEKLPGITILLVDVSGSMYGHGAQLSGKSDLYRGDAAAALAILVREVSDAGVILTFSEQIALVPSRRGMALRDAIHNSQSHGGTYLRMAVEKVSQQMPCDRLIVITDEQSHDGNGIVQPGCRGYILNVGSHQNGVGRRDQGWTTITGFSEACVKYIIELEKADGWTPPSQRAASPIVGLDGKPLN